jgi:uncharacterized protein (DUF111 family)
VVNSKIEYDDLKRLALENGETIKNVSAEIYRLLD